jgi:hypothetical protein
LIRANLNHYHETRRRGAVTRTNPTPPGREDPMYRHMPTCPQGSVTHHRLHWLFNPSAEVETEPFRHDLVARLRRQIADGLYETPEKWEAALDRLAEELA